MNQISPLTMKQLWCNGEATVGLYSFRQSQQECTIDILTYDKCIYFISLNPVISNMTPTPPATMTYATCECIGIVYAWVCGMC